MEINLNSGAFIAKGFLPIFFTEENKIPKSDIVTEQSFLVFNESKKEFKIIHINSHSEIFETDNLYFFGIYISKVCILRKDYFYILQMKYETYIKTKIIKEGFLSIKCSQTDIQRHNINRIFQKLIDFTKTNKELINQFGFSKDIIDLPSIEDFQFHEVLNIINKFKFVQTNSSTYIPQKDNRFQEDVTISIPKETNKYLINLVCQFYNGYFDEKEFQIKYVKNKYSSWTASHGDITFEIDADRYNKLIDFIWKNLDENQFLCHNVLEVK